jgi:hypothetical protein
MTPNRFWFAFTVFVLLYVVATEATLVPTLELDNLSDDAALIVVGQITSVQEVGKTTVPIGNRSVSARMMIADLRVDQVLKGATQTNSSLRFHFALPDEFIGWRSITPQSYRVFFLTDNSGELKVANPYYPSVVAIPGAESRGETAIERVAHQLGAVLESSRTPIEQKQEAVFTLNSSRSPAAVRALRSAAEIQDVTVRLSVAAALLEHNDISILPYAEDALLKPNPTLSPDLLHNLSYAISEGVKDDRAIPSLTKLLHASNVEARRAAASALTHTGSTSSIDPLLSALGDPDRDVRYYSAIGLAEITGQTDWRPNMDDFFSDEQHFLNHWKDWARNR